MIRGIRTNNPKYKVWWKSILPEGGEFTEEPMPRQFIRICIKCLDYNEEFLDEIGECKFYYLGRTVVYACKQDSDNEPYTNAYICYGDNYILDHYTYRKLTFTNPYDHQETNRYQ